LGASVAVVGLKPEKPPPVEPPLHTKSNALICNFVIKIGTCKPKTLKAKYKSKYIIIKANYKHKHSNCKAKHKHLLFDAHAQYKSKPKAKH
jgi:hypothetical protein